MVTLKNTYQSRTHKENALFSTVPQLVLVVIYIRLSSKIGQYSKSSSTVVAGCHCFDF